MIESAKDSGHYRGDAFPAAKLRVVLLAAQSFQHNAGLLFSRVLPARLTPNVLQHLFCRRLISVSSSLLGATMNQKSSLREDPQFVS
jgi:hypothetical protein